MTSICVGRVEALVVLDVDNDIVFAGFGEKIKVIAEELGRGLGDQNVDFALNGVQGNGVVGWVGSKDSDCGACGEGVDSGFVGFWVGGVIGGKGGEGDVEVVVDFGDVLLKMRAWFLLVSFGAG